MSKRRYKHFYRALRRPFERFAVATALRIVPPLSLAQLLRLAHFVGDTVYTFDPGGRAIARANLKVMFGDRMTPARERAITRLAYRNMARVLVNIFWMSHDTAARIKDQVALSPWVIDALRTHQPAITVSAHFGNWEILSQACVSEGIPMMSVAKEVGSQEMTERLTALRSTIGQKIVPADGALRQLILALKRGTSLGLLIDQHTHEWDGGTWVTLFGIRAGISLAPAMLSRKFQTPILFAWSRPLKDGRYRVEPGELFMPAPDIDDSARTQQLATAFERVIRRHPSLWCLNYRRWRYIYPGDDPARYPFYARPARKQKAGA